MGQKLLGVFSAAIIASAATSASAALLLNGSFADSIPFGPFAPNQVITVVADVTNTSLDQTITICEGVCIGDSYTYSLGASASIPNGYSFIFGNGSSTSLGIWNGQIAGSLLPGEQKDFVFGMYTPIGAVAPGWYAFGDQIQIFAATAERPLLGTTGIGGRWQVVEPIPEPTTLALLGLGLAGLGFSRRRTSIYRQRAGPQ